MTEATMTMKNSRYRWVRHEGERLVDVGVNADGTLHNPNGYPDAVVRAAVGVAERHQARVDAIARRLVAGGTCGPSPRCVICGRALDDADSVQRGIGSECWHTYSPSWNGTSRDGDRRDRDRRDRGA